MAGKKKKVVSNPARGFATTSIASKPKVTKNDEATEDPSPSKAAENTDAKAPSNDVNSKAPSKALDQLSPQELEIELEKNDLQMLVDSIGPKVHRESSRQLNRIQTERRTLRNQSQDLFVRDWMNEKFVNQVIEMASAEVRNDKGASEQIYSLKSSSEEDLVSRFWTLLRTLSSFGIASDQVNQVLKTFAAQSPSTDNSGQIWGFQDSVDMLALECTEEELPPFESDKLKPGSSSSLGKLLASWLGPSVPCAAATMCAMLALWIMSLLATLHGQLA